MTDSEAARFFALADALGRVELMGRLLLEIVDDGRRGEQRASSHVLARGVELPPLHVLVEYHVALFATMCNMVPHIRNQGALQLCHGAIIAEDSNGLGDGPVIP